MTSLISSSQGGAALFAGVRCGGGHRRCRKSPSIVMSSAAASTEPITVVSRNNALFPVMVRTDLPMKAWRLHRSFLLSAMFLDGFSPKFWTAPLFSGFVEGFGDFGKPNNLRALHRYWSLATSWSACLLGFGFSLCYSASVFFFELLVFM